MIYFNESVERRDEGDLRIFRSLPTDIARTEFSTVALNKDPKIARLTVGTTP
ncbi:MAG: hypothetical protein ABIZ91_00245 [Gemmatimonadaceae bacterium]